MSDNLGEEETSAEGGADEISPELAAANQRLRQLREISELGRSGRRPDGWVSQQQKRRHAHVQKKRYLIE